VFNGSLRSICVGATGADRRPRVPLNDLHSLLEKKGIPLIIDAMNNAEYVLISQSVILHQTYTQDTMYPKHLQDLVENKIEDGHGFFFDDRYGTLIISKK